MNANPSLGGTPADPSAAVKGPVSETAGRLKNFLRERLKVWIVLTVSGAAMGAFVYQQCAPPTYRCTGLVRITPQRPHVLADDREGASGHWGYLMSQTHLMQSQQVLEAAVRTKAWKAVGRDSSDDNVRQFRRCLDIAPVRDSELVSVSFSDASPAAANAGVAALLDAYLAFPQRDADSEARKLEVLQRHEDLLVQRLATVQEQTAALSGEWGTDDLGPVYLMRLAQLAQREEQLRDAQRLLHDGAIDVTAADGQAALALLDGTMRAYLREREIAQRQLDDLLTRMGQQHPAVVSARTVLARITEASDNYAAELRRSAGTVLIGAHGQISGPPAIATPARLDARQRTLEEHYAQALTTCRDLAQRGVQIKLLQIQAQGMQERLDRVRRRIDEVRLDSELGTRVTVLSRGERPLDQFTQRHLQTAAGAAAGALFVFGLIALAGVIDPRYRGPSDAMGRLKRLPILGAAPRVAGRNADVAQAVEFRQTARRVRAALEVEGAGAVVAVTSASRGAGRTTFVTALGAAIASTRARALLVDLDLGHRDLTARAAGGSSTGHGGLAEALDGAALGDCIASLEPQLHVLGASSDRDWSQGVSLTALRSLLDRAKSEFDAVIIDAGPMGQSIEAGLAAAAADSVLFVVRQGDRHRAIERALGQLASAGAHVSGAVLNGARSPDEASIVSAPLATMRIAGRRHAEPQTEIRQAMRSAA
jgi:Mrp family chromosome partitioning ATPase/uncharacterized protein involved in exopolysaccharide biosynthesis